MTTWAETIGLLVRAGFSFESGHRFRYTDQDLSSVAQLHWTNMGSEEVLDLYAPLVNIRELGFSLSDAMGKASLGLGGLSLRDDYLCFHFRTMLQGVTAPKLATIIGGFTSGARRQREALR